MIVFLHHSTGSLNMLCPCTGRVSGWVHSHTCKLCVQIGAPACTVCVRQTARLCACVCLDGCARLAGGGCRAVLSHPPSLLCAVSVTPAWGSICKAWSSLGSFRARLQQARRRPWGCQVCPFPGPALCSAPAWTLPHFGPITLFRFLLPFLLFAWAPLGDLVSPSLTGPTSCSSHELS